MAVSREVASYQGQQEIVDAINGFTLSGVGQKAVWFDSVSSMQRADIPAGATAATRGYTTVNDGGNAFYYIREKTQSDVEDGGSIIFLDNENVAELITDGTVNVKQFGAVGDGVTDDTVAIQKCLDFGRNVFIPDGTYLIYSTKNDGTPATGGIKVHSNTTVTLTQNAILKSTTNLTGDYDVLSIRGVQNVVIRGGKIEGDKTPPSQPPYRTEFGFGISVYNSDNITIDNVESYNHWGDGIICDGSYESDTCNYVTIKNCNIHDCRRQGISIITCNHLVIQGCYIHDIEGTMPNSCIDLEGYSTAHSIHDVKILDCVFNNVGGSRQELVISTASDDIYIDGCTFNNYLYSSYDVYYPEKNVTVKNSTMAGLSQVSGHLFVSNCTIGAVYITYDSIKLICEGCVFNGCRDYLGEVLGIATGQSPSYIDISFMDCVFDLPTKKDADNDATRFVSLTATMPENPDIKISFLNCSGHLQNRTTFVDRPEFHTLVKNCNFKFSKRAYDTFAATAWLEIDGTEFTFEESGGVRLVSFVTDQPIHLALTNNVINGDISPLSYNYGKNFDTSQGWSSPFSVVINNNIQNCAAGNFFGNQLVIGAGSTNVTVVGGNNYGVTLS